MNIFNYIINSKNYELIEINTLDALIFSRLSYIHFEEITDVLPITIYRLFNYIDYVHTNKNDKKLIELLKESNRFKNIVISRCQHISNIENEEEFTAITINLPNKNKFVSFRGTTKKIYDFKEDMNMSFKEIPSSFDATSYLQEERNYRKIYLGGHSKGGHLAIYAASHVGYFKQRKINKIYNFDGPGFLEIDKRLKQIKDKILNYFPENSIVGRIMFNPSPIIPVKTQKQGIEAHNLYNWQIINNNLLIGRLNNKSNEFYNRCLNILQVLSVEKREMVINYIFLLIKKGEIKSFKELNITKTRHIINKAPHLTKEEKQELLSFFKVLIKCSIPQITKKNHKYIKMIDKKEDN